ncbi:MAG: hypothetical protein R3D68_07070 [Hyphomicrobiaceae bacterium]
MLAHYDSTPQDYNPNIVLQPGDADVDAASVRSWMNDAQLLDYVDDDVLDRVVTVAFGRNQEDRAFQNVTGTVEQLLNDLTKFQIGPKNGRCLLQGELVGGHRLAKAMKTNHILMLDLDTGETVQDVREKLVGAGWFGYIWTTHSHNGTVTDIPEAALIRYVERDMRRDMPFDDEDIADVCLSYLKHVRKYQEHIVTSAAFVGREFGQVGVVYRMTHDPLPKMRVMLVLREPFSFLEGGTQAQRIDLWKKVYAAVAERLNVTFDPACTDPSRLMFTPRVGSSEADRDAVIVPGAMVDLAPIISDLSVTSRFADVGTGRHSGAVSNGGVAGAAMTPGLMEFLKTCPDFKALDWLRSIAPEDERKGGPKGGAHWRCPNDDNHSDAGNPDDVGFAVFQNDEGWGFNCLHATCKTEIGTDRARYLDLLCQAYGVGDAEALYEFSEAGSRKKDDREEIARLAGDEKALEDAIAALPDRATTDETRIVLAAIGTTDALRRERLIPVLGKKLGLRKPALSKLIAGSCKETSSSSRLVDDGLPHEYGGLPVILKDDNHNDQVAALVDAMKAQNERDVQYVLVAGHLAKIDRDLQVGAVSTVLKKDEVWNEAAKLCWWQGKKRGEAPDHEVTDRVALDKELDLPPLNGIVRTPTIRDDGSWLSQPGYDERTGYYLDLPQGFDPLPPPEIGKITEDDVKTSVNLLVRDLLVDFPFSDSFGGGDEPTNAYIDEKDDAGWPCPNLERGAGSRSNMIAALITPHIKAAMGDAATPLFMFDAPYSGEGKSTLSDVVMLVADGKQSEKWSYSKGESRKTITAKVVERRTHIVLDNVKETLSDPALEAALTSGIWTDRLLGYFETVSLPFKLMMMVTLNQRRWDAT